MYHSTPLPRSPERQPTSPQQYSPRTAYARLDVAAQPLYHDHRGQQVSQSSNSLPAMKGYSPHSRTKSASTFYDPTSENGERQPSWTRAAYPASSPSHPNQTAERSPPRHDTWREPARASPRSPTAGFIDQSRHNPAYPDGRSERVAAEPVYGSPVVEQRMQQSPAFSTTSYPRAASHHDLQIPSPNSSRAYQNHVPASVAPVAPTQERLSSLSSSDRNPMSFSNILSNSDPEPETPNTSASHPPAETRPLTDSVTLQNTRELNQVKVEPMAPSVQLPSANNETDMLRTDSAGRSPKLAMSVSAPEKYQQNPNTPRSSSSLEKNGIPIRTEAEAAPPQKPIKTPKIFVPEKDIDAAMLRIESMEHSDADGPGFEVHRTSYFVNRKKRIREHEYLEASNQKRRRIWTLELLAKAFAEQAQASRQRFKTAHEQAMMQEVQDREIADEKERKKDMQRKRRREKTILTEKQKSYEAAKKAQQATDKAEKDKYLKEMRRAEHKASATTKLLKGETPNKALREITPHGPNMEGGVMSSFQTVDDLPAEPVKKRIKTGGRLKKSKEQKQQEKANAAAAHAAMERDEHVAIAPKEDVVETAKKEYTAPKDSTSDQASVYVGKVYNQLYDAIWKDIARKDIPKLHRIKDASTATKASNLRKTAILASKEARKWQTKTNKSMKDNQARAKRVMREMLSFWKRNEREERDQRKMAEKQELENAKKAEADREANRQKRKLNFLISQTELYSHFIGKKVKTDEVERSTDSVGATGNTITPGAPQAHVIDLPDTVAKVGTKVTNFEDLDFDADDDTALQEAAMANAQNAIQEAQDRARAFNNDGQLQSQFDDGEMNFQNPTSLQNMDVAQPKMLTCQLKEYQLKGLNWLVNLYEQGINGILADEMGLGKTVQSISVMAYLAEVHNIWGPFLVIAPASTLHNWQQEFTRFVPDLTVLPYWGNAKDRKVLRKFWDRKHITYNRDSPFHVLVTSYQLVVQDTQYFQKIRWQYMVLDEAQAIKSSQSSRWKSLLGFHCRNRLLLTGTPIQNNMQELWALLHFIMPSLFDSHDEFSDWFSKDIESHAQSNTKLNEDQLKRLHMILKPFMLRRIKKHVQKELGDKIEEDVFCDLTYRQRAYYANLRNKISIMDLIEKASVGDDQDAATLMNLVMQFRKVCNHPDLFERAETTSPVSFAHFAETASFMREGYQIEVGYSVRNLIEFKLPRLVGRNNGRLDIAGPDNEKAGWRQQFLFNEASIWSPQHMSQKSNGTNAFSWLRFIDTSLGEVSSLAHKDSFQRALDLFTAPLSPSEPPTIGDTTVKTSSRLHALFNIVDNNIPRSTPIRQSHGRLYDLLNVSRSVFYGTGLNAIEPCARPAVSAPPIELYCASQGSLAERQSTFFNMSMRIPFSNITEKTEQAILESKLDPSLFPIAPLPAPISEKARYTRIQVPSMRRFVTDSGKLAKLDRLLAQLKEGGHRVLLYFQMTRMIDLMEEYLTYRNYKYCRLDGSTKLEDRRDTVADFQTRSDIFIFLLSTRAGGLGINLTAADTVIFYDSDWNPTIDSQAMDRAHRLGQTKQVTVYRLITRSTIEERIRKRALQKEEVQRVVISGGAGAHVDFNTRSRENRTKDIALWLADDDQAAEIEKKEAELAEREARDGTATRKGRKGYVRKRPDVTLDDMYHEGEGHFDDNSNKPSGAATPVEMPAKGKRRGISKKAKSIREKLAIADGGV